MSRDANGSLDAGEALGVTSRRVSELCWLGGLAMYGRTSKKSSCGQCTQGRREFTKIPRTIGSLYVVRWTEDATCLQQQVIHTRVLYGPVARGGREVASHNPTIKRARKKDDTHRFSVSNPVAQALVPFLSDSLFGQVTAERRGKHGRGEVAQPRKGEMRRKIKRNSPPAFLVSARPSSYTLHSRPSTKTRSGKLVLDHVQIPFNCCTKTI